MRIGKLFIYSENAPVIIPAAIAVSPMMILKRCLLLSNEDVKVGADISNI